MKLSFSKKALNALLSIVLVVGLAPTVAWAEGQGDVAGGDPAPQAQQEPRAQQELQDQFQAQAQATEQAPHAQAFELDAGLQDVPTSGEIGGCTWEIVAGTLTIAPTLGGSGQLPDGYAAEGDWPWHEQHDSITNAVIAPGVKAGDSTACMFYECVSLESIEDLSNLDTSNVTNMKKMFNDCSKLETLDLSGLITSNVTNMGYMFSNCSSFNSINLTGLDTSKVTTMHSMFSSCKKLTDIAGFSDLNTSNVTDMGYMFSNCLSFTSLNLSGLDTSNVTDMEGMIEECTSLESLNLSGLDTSKVENMACMFCECESLESIEGLSDLDTSKVTNMAAMFVECPQLTSLDLSGFDTSNVVEMGEMFVGCLNLETIFVSDKWTTEGLGEPEASIAGVGPQSEFQEVEEEEGNYMFAECISLVGGAGTVYDEGHTGADYARIDKGPNSDEPGYLTAAPVKPADDDQSESADTDNPTESAKTGDAAPLAFAGLAAAAAAAAGLALVASRRRHEW